MTTVDEIVLFSNLVEALGDKYSDYNRHLEVEQIQERAHIIPNSGDGISTPTTGSIDDLLRLAKSLSNQGEFFAKILPLFGYQNLAQEQVNFATDGPEKTLIAYMVKISSFPSNTEITSYLLHAIGTRSIERVQEAGKIVMGYISERYNNEDLILMKIDDLERCHDEEEPLITLNFLQAYPELNGELALTILEQVAKRDPHTVRQCVSKLMQPDVIAKVQSKDDYEKFGAYIHSVVYDTPD